jgi:hypothetical protein
MPAKDMVELFAPLRGLDLDLSAIEDFIGVHLRSSAAHIKCPDIPNILVK